MNNAVLTRSVTIALAGNPNAGKTTLFNFLTGLKQKVANYPGVTVERKEGVWNLPDGAIQVVDLPGLYSLDATSLDEQIASDIIRGEIDSVRPEAIVAVVDATNLERNLYLVTQILELGIPCVIALTMIDVFEKERHEIDVEMLSVILKAPIVPLNVKTGRGVEDLGRRLREVMSRPVEIPAALGAAGEESGPNGRIFARYNFISNAVQESVWHSDQRDHRISEKIDRVLTHRFFGLVILAGILLLVFQAIFSWSSVPMDLLEQTFSGAGDFARQQLPPGILADLIVDGIIAGVGGVVVFLPQILLLFLFISLLEDSGYMARAAFLLDKLMSRVGLHGKAFLPLFSSFACAIPGIMATRTIENRRDRFATILIAPLMSCSARLPVYTLMIAAFFSGQTVLGFLSLGAVLMLGMYTLGIAVAIIVAFILKRTILKAPPPPFLMELPPYRVPNLRAALQNMFTRASLFLKRAGTVILAISIVLWALMYFPRTVPTETAPVNEVAAQEESSAISDESAQLANSFAGKIGHAIEPVIEPLGFDWKVGVALIASFAAREVLVSTLSIIYNVGKDANEESENLLSAVRDAKRDDGSPAWTPLTALSLMVFFVLAMQCMSTLAIVRRETNSWRWPLFMFGYMTVLAYAGAFVTYQGGRLLGFE